MRAASRVLSESRDSDRMVLPGPVEVHGPAARLCRPRGRPRGRVRPRPRLGSRRGGGTTDGARGRGGGGDARKSSASVPKVRPAACPSPPHPPPPSHRGPVRRVGACEGAKAPAKGLGAGGGSRSPPARCIGAYASGGLPRLSGACLKNDPSGDV